jgi:tetratricopeptide (TPR) repeat protein
MRRPTEAISYFQHVLELEPQMVGVHHNLAVCRFLENDFERGIQHCQDALQIEPENFMALHKLALAYLHLGRWQDVRQTTARGLAVNPNHAGLNMIRKRFWWLRLKRFCTRLIPQK